jgi:hypothetical protein
MKFASILSTFIVLVPFLACEVMGQYVILQVLLNNGNKTFKCIDRWDNCCNSTEWNFIQSKVYAMSQNQRDLEENSAVSAVEALDTSTHGGNSTDVDRDLSTSYPRSCANSCAGIAAGRCMALNCLGYRKLSESEANSKPSSLRPKRDLFYSTSCENQKSEMRNLLTNIQSGLGARCRALLNAPRNMTCFSSANC